MFDPFTDRARRVVVLAQAHARALNHNYVGSEHLLLGLFHESEGIASRALVSVGVSADTLASAVEEIVGTGIHTSNGHLPFTPGAKQVLEGALQESTQLGDSCTDTEHLLLAVLLDSNGAAVQVLMRLGADQTAVRSAVLHRLHARTPAPTRMPELTSAPTTAEPEEEQDSLRLSRIHLRVKDLAASRAFYETLGMEFFKDTTGGSVAKLNASTAIELEQSPAPPTSGLRLRFTADDLAATLDRMQRLGHRIFEDGSGLRTRARIEDPHGNIVELVARYALAA